MANTFREVYKKTGTSSYQLVGNVGVGGVKLDVMKGATSNASGEIGLVPKPSTGQQNYILTGAGSFSNIRTVLNDEGYGAYTSNLTGTGCYVRYNEQVVFITLNAKGVFTSDTRTKLIVLPENVIGNSNILFQNVNVLNANWNPINNVAYLDFSNQSGSNTKYRNPTVRLLSSTSSTIVLVGTLVFPRNFFAIGDEIQGTVTIG